MKEAPLPFGFGERGVHGAVDAGQSVGDDGGGLGQSPGFEIGQKLPVGLGGLLRGDGIADDHAVAVGVDPHGDVDGLLLDAAAPQREVGGIEVKAEKPRR